MGHRHEAEIRRSPQLAHLPRGRLERVCNDRNRRNSGFFQDDCVEQTARRTRASVADPDDGEVSSAFKLFNLRIFERGTLLLVQ